VDLDPESSARDPAVWIVRPDRSPSSELSAAREHLGLTDPRPVLVLVGGAANLAHDIRDELLHLFERIAPLLDALDAAVIDGGTAFGVMAVMGQARHRSGAGFPLLGIAPQGAVAIDEDASNDPANTGDKARLDPNHTHFLLVPGEHWGDESPWLGAAADHLADGRATLMMVAAGGDVTRLDVMHRLHAGGRVLVLAGSGGTADRLSDWRRTGRVSPDFEQAEAARMLIDVLNLTDAPGMLPAILERALAH
jgi:hypothetical protein